MFALALAAGCSDPLEKDTMSIYDTLPLAQYLESAPQYSEWSDLVKHAGLYNALNVKSTFTAFVQQNDSLLAFLNTHYGVASVEEMDPQDARDFVRYHVIEGRLYTHSMFVEGRIPDTTSSGDYLVTGFGGDGINSIYVGTPESVITLRDVKLVNAIVHQLGKPMVPIAKTIWQTLQEDPAYSIFTGAVGLTGISERLNRIRYAMGEQVYRDFMTLFVVTDAQFQADGINNLEDLKARFSPTHANYTEPGNGLYNYVAYHVLTRYYSYSDLADFTGLPSSEKSLNALALNELIGVEDYKQQIVLNREGENGILLTRYNRAAKNGIIHEVDNLMPVYTPPARTVIFEPTLTPEFTSLPGYGGVMSADYYSPPFPEGSLSAIRWETIPAGVGSVIYNARNTSVFVKLLHRDVLVFNMGTVGWIEMDMPIIVKGKYTVSATYHQGSGRGTYQPFIDGQKFGDPVNFSGGFAQISKVIGAVDFAVNSAHKLRFVAINAGQVDLDHIAFEPIK
jgi:uncharacterized surface protein with fasciclin (FAS1) repeats